MVMGRLKWDVMVKTKLGRPASYSLTLYIGGCMHIQREIGSTGPCNFSSALGRSGSKVVDDCELVIDR